MAPNAGPNDDNEGPGLEEVLQNQSQSIIEVQKEGSSMQQHNGQSVPDDQSMLSGIAARYNHDSGMPKTIPVGNTLNYTLDSNKLGFSAFNNTAMQNSLR